MSKDLVIFGPWCGEFSFEFQFWVPEIRKQRNTQFKDFYAIHVGYEGRSILYRDFIDEYITYPKDLEDTLVNPSNCMQIFPSEDPYTAGRGIPDQLKIFLEQLCSHYQNTFESVVVYLPPADPNRTTERSNQQLPDAEYKYYSASEDILNEMKKEIAFEDSERKTVAILARFRYRVWGRTAIGEPLENGLRLCGDDWNPKHWETFVDMLINVLNLNVCVIDIPPIECNGGSLSFRDSEVYKRNSRHIKSIRFEGKDSVERQIALLQLTDCSIYGATGAAMLSYFVGTPVFMQAAKEFSHRLQYQWHKNLTNNLKNVCIVDDCVRSELRESSPIALFEKFNSFWQELNDEKNNI